MRRATIPSPVGARSPPVKTMRTEHEQLEAAVRQAWDGNDFERAATLAFEGYGDELLAFLVGRLRSPSDGQEVFSMFAEDLWVGLPSFGWRSSLRTWAYTIARNAAVRYLRDPQRRGERNLTLSKHASVSRVAEQVRSRTAKHMRTDVKDRVRALRDQLDADDQLLLELRIDQGMSFRDAAQVMMGEVEGEGDTDPAVLDREAARLRKRFERVKVELKRMAQAQGLIS